MNTIVKKETLKDKIISILMQKIIDQEIKIGDKLKEAHLAKEFGVSQAPVREAIVALVTLGILEHKVNVGASVKAHSDAEIIEIYEARDALERYSVSNIKNFEKVVTMKKSYTLMLEAVKKNDIKAYVIHDQDFHETLVSMSENKIILELWKQQYTKSSVINVVKKFESTLDDIVSLHLPIIEAIEKQVLLRCRFSVENHYNKIIQNIKDK